MEKRKLRKFSVTRCVLLLFLLICSINCANLDHHEDSELDDDSESILNSRSSHRDRLTQRLFDEHEHEHEDDEDILSHHSLPRLFPGVNHDLMSEHSEIISIGSPGLLGKDSNPHHQLIVDGGSSGHHVLPQGLCEPIKIGLCMDLGYNQTTMPNLVGHDVQADADALLQTFTPLIQYGCSPHLKLFLCSSHAPMCTDKVPDPIGPCRSLCESVRRKCEPVLIEFGFKWPPNLECTKFHPENNHRHMCIPGPMESSGGSSGKFPGSGSGGFGGQIDPKLFGHFNNPTSSDEQHLFIQIPKSKGSGSGLELSSILLPNLNNKNLPSLPKANLPESKCLSLQKFWIKDHCWTKCEKGDSAETGVLFQPVEKTFARNYALPWAILSLICAIGAIVLAFYSKKVNVAERPIIYIALCQVLFSIGIIIGTSSPPSALTCFTDKGTGLELQAGQGMIPRACAVVFLLTYFFGIAGTIWWVILCLSWMLSLSTKLCLSLTTQREWSVFHLLSWGLASVFTSVALLNQKVDADFVFGVCGVGYQDTEALINYNLIPLGLSLGFGLLFLFIGLICRLQICSFHHTKSKCPNNNALARHNHAYSPTATTTTIPISTATTLHNHHHHHLNSCGCCINNIPIPNHCTTFTTTTSLTTTSSTGGNNSTNIFYHQNPTGNRLVNYNNSNTNIRIQQAKPVWIRVGIFSIVTAIPVGCQVATLVYEVYNRAYWETGQSSPSLQIFLLKLNMELIAGLTTGVWALSTYSWKSFSLSSIISQKLCCFFKLFHLPTKNPKIRGTRNLTVLGDSASNNTASSTLSPLLVPVPANSSTTSYITLNGNHQQHSTFGAGRQQQQQPTFAGIAPFSQRFHNGPTSASMMTVTVPLVPPLPARNPPTSGPAETGWRRTETIL